MVEYFISNANYVLYHGFPVGGAKPKTPRPDLVPNTPPKDEPLAEPLPKDDDDDDQKPGTSATNTVKFMTPPPTRSVNVNEIAIQTETGTPSEPFRMEELERKLSEVDESVLNLAARLVNVDNLHLERYN